MLSCLASRLSPHSHSRATVGLAWTFGGLGCPKTAHLCPPQQVQGSPEGHLSSKSVVLSAPAAYS